MVAVAPNSKVDIIHSMKKLFVSLILAMCASTAWCALDANAVVNAGFNKLTESQKAAIIQQVAGNADKGDAASPIASAVTDPKQMNEWLDVGTKIGQMFGGAAKEVGLAVNDFVKTPVGMWTMAIIVWKYMGGVLVHLFGGIMVLTVGLSMTIWILNSRTSRTVKYDTTKTDWFGRSTVVSIERSNLSDDWTVGGWFMMAVVILVSLLVTFTY